MTLFLLQILFYCHHPDLLLTQRRSWARNLYRAPLDFAEQATTGKANKLLVNSLYTQGSHPCRGAPANLHVPGMTHGKDALQQVV